MHRCLFCRIANRDACAHEVYRDDDLVAFLDISPIRRGHTQTIPVGHIACFDDLPARLANKIMGLGQKLAKAQKRVLAVERVAFLYTGGDVPHVHAHVVPLIEKDDITSRRYIQEAVVTYRDLPTPSDESQRELASQLCETLEV